LAHVRTRVRSAGRKYSPRWFGVARSSSSETRFSLR